MNHAYIVMVVFFAGTVFEAVLASRSWRKAFITVTIAGVCWGLGWLTSLDDSDRILPEQLHSIFFFVLFVAFYIREELLPRISPATLLHYALVTVYAIYSWSATAPEPGLVVAVVAIALLVALFLGTSSKPPDRFLQLVGYVCYLILLTALIGAQVSLDSIEAVVLAEAFTFSLFIHIFVAGMVFLVFAANIVHLLVLIPTPRWSSSSGSSEAREHRDFLRSKMSGRTISALAAVLWIAHAGALVANYRWELVAPGTWVNAAIVAIAMLPPWTADDVRSRHADSADT